MTSVPTQERLSVVDAATVEGKQVNLDVDVVIVGSGAGGAVMAYELAREGRSVVMLEAGSYIPSTEFTEHYPQMLARLYQDGGNQTNLDGDLLVLQGRCLGGSTVVNAAACFRTPDAVLEEWQRDYGLNDLTPERLKPIFEKVEKNLSVHVNLPHEIDTNCRVIERGCEKLGLSYKPLARNINSCSLSGFCLAGCASDRKQSMLVTYIPWAIQHGAQVFVDTKVEKIWTEGDRVGGVDAVMSDPSTGQTVANVRARGKVVVLAAGAVQSPILLQKSGLANGSGMVGKNFACHPSLGLLADFDDDIYGWRGATLGSYCDEWENREEGRFILEFAMAGADFLAPSSPGIADTHLEFMSRFKNVAGMISLIHDKNVGEVKLNDKGQKEIHYQLAEADKPTMRMCVKKAAEIYFAAGANKVFVPTYDPVIIEDPTQIDQLADSLQLEALSTALVSYHPQGTCRMGADAATSVVNPTGECHEVPGLFVADASLFPTSMMVNPQITVYSLSTYVSEHLNNHADRYF